MDITFRPANESDLSKVHLVHEGVLPTGSESAQNERARLLLYHHLLDTDPKGFWVAEHRDEVIGFSSAIVRGDVWFLSDFFVSPSYQGQGVGGKLLGFSLLTSSNSKIRSVHSTLDPKAVCLYARSGMFPLTLFIDLEGDVSQLHLHKTRNTISEVHELKTIDMVKEMSEIDTNIWGSERYRDHHYWIESNRYQCFLAWNRTGKLIGYYYLCLDTRTFDPTIGPLAIIGCEAMREMLIFAISEVQRNSSKATLKVPAENHAAIQLLISNGFKIKAFWPLMSNRIYGRFGSYLPSGPDLL